MANSKPERKVLRSSEKLGSLIENYYRESFEAKSRGKPVAWLTSVAPTEICYAMDVFPVLPENYGAMCAARKLAAEFCTSAEARGYSPDLCSYSRNHLGSIFEGRGPFGGRGLPDPDFLLATEYACSTHVKWWEALARHYNVPLFVIDATYTVDEGLKPYHLEYFISQFKELISALEDLTQRKLDMDRFKEVLDLSDETGRLWLEIADMRKAVPTPVAPADIFTTMFPVVTLSGKEETVEYYKELRDEIKERVDRGEGAIPNERYRLIWDLFPLWYKLGLLNYMEEQGAICAIDIYALGFSGRLDSSNPFESLAYRYPGNRMMYGGVRDRIEIYKGLVKDYKIDGMVFHSNRICRYASMGQLDIKQAMLEEFGIPSMIFEGDMTDPRSYSDSQVKETIDSFLELLESR
ncbi:MAG: 2-hydroxyacyl-CoA dehydratase family protein [Pseudomonadota bacterium]